MAALKALCFITLFICNFAQDNRPNIILLMTDDQDIVLDSMQAMPNTIELVANQGITFTNAFISTPICCPSRTETISGRYFQNVLDGDTSKCMHVSSLYNIFNNTKSIFQKFQSGGYLTGTFGKLVNNQQNAWCPKNKTQPIPTTGFTRINGPCTVGYYNKESFELFMNGSQVTQTIQNPVAENYFTSVIGNLSLSWMEEVFQLKTRKPLIAWIGPHAPHYPASPSAWYANRFNNATAPRTPNWNIKNTGHHDFVSTNPSINDSNSGAAVSFIDQLYRDRLRSLLSVDDIIVELFKLLKKYNELDNTVIVTTSDHGYDLGQLRIPCSKQEPYETAIRIPMYMYAPDNIIKKKGIKIKNIVGNVDLLPTFLDIADIKYNVDDYDGKSWFGSLIGNETNNKFNRDIYLSQYESVGTYYFSHCNTWFPAKDGSVVPGNTIHPPEANSKNELWYVDDTQTNNWRALRIINESMDVTYVEFVNSSWNATFDEPYFVEFYNITNDKWQINNVYDSLSKDMQKIFHETLMQKGQCKGSDCW